MKSKFLQFVLLLFAIIGVEKLHAKAEIEIKGIERILVAPLGSDYHWYKNGEAIDLEASFELDSITESGLYVVEYVDVQGIKEQLEVYVISEEQAIRKIFLVGDSTVANYNASASPMTGWGQVLQKFINANAFTVVNRAIGGRSSRSFVEEGRWTSVKAEMASGDYVMIQFGHNDRDFSKAERYTPPADYKVYLYQYVNEARVLGAIPILVTPMVLNAWRNGALRNVFTESGAEYVQKMKEVATELKVPLVDLNQKSWDYVSAAGVDYDTRFIYNTYLAGEYPNYPTGLTDYTHFQEMGALLMAKFISDGLSELKTNTLVQPIANELRPLYSLTVNTNVVGGGTLTKAMQYPEGVNITLKALVNTGHTFLNWKNPANATVSTNNIYTFVMPSQAVTYTAIFDSEPVIKDCAGIAGGTAKLDNCGICTGGTSPFKPCKALTQAEEACRVDGILLESSNAGFTGTGYANTNNAIGAQIQIDLIATASGSTQLVLKYANGGTTNRDAILKINNQTIGTFALPPTGAWTTWASAQLSNVAITKGINTLVLEATTDGGIANIDFVSWDLAGLQKTRCTITANEEKLEAKALAIYPNPFTNSLMIEHLGTFQYVINTLNGEILETATCTDTCKVGASLSKGTYLFSINTDSEHSTYKIIKE